MIGKSAEILEKDIELLEKIFKKIDWKIICSLYIGGTTVYSPFDLHRETSDIDIFAIANDNEFVEKVLSFTSAGLLPPKNQQIDCLETVFKNIPEMHRKVSLHVFSKQAIEKIVNLSNEALFVWRVPSSGFTAEWDYRSVVGKKVKKKIEIKEFPPDAYLCTYTLTHKENGEIYYGTQVQQLITYGVPIVDQEGFFTSNILQLQQNILSQIDNFENPSENSISQYWLRHDFRAFMIMRLRAIAYKNKKLKT